MSNIKKRGLFIFILLIIIAFTVYKIGWDKKASIQKRNTEARDDSVKMAEVLSLQSKIKNALTATMETKAVRSAVGEDAADDPAIWINKKEPHKSLIIGTDKKSGLYSYNLKGEVVQFLEVGELNNVDLRDGFSHKGKLNVLIAASNRSINTISLFFLNEETLEISDRILDIKSRVNEVYGLCMHRDLDNRFYVFVNGKDGVVEQYEITSNGQKIQSAFCRQLKVNSQPEGMVCNDLTSDLYIGVEEEGIFLASAKPDASDSLLLINRSSKDKNDQISYDIEGLAIYQTTNKSYLVASIQGNFSYAIFDIKNTDSIQYITSFTIENGIFDGVEETDGIEITSFPINENYPKGMLVVQDGFNYQGDTLISQNFKYISWESIERYLK